MSESEASNYRLFSFLEQLVLAAGVSGSEQAVAEIIEACLQEAGFPSGSLQSDYLGNRWLSFGPSGESGRILIAHMDEIGFRVSSIRADGRAHLISIGGNDPQLWEGSPVHVHCRSGRIAGCIAPVSHHVTLRQGLASDKRIGQQDMLLDIGASSRGEAEELGLAVLDPVTWPKELWRLPNQLVQGRSLDDRFGCASLLELALRLREQPPAVPTVLAWAVQEEVGLRGAKALAQRFPGMQEAVAVDSFTVGAGPRDNQQYDSARLGGGAVLRGLDSTTIMPEEARSAVLEKAQRLGFNLQTGFMPGGNDASEFEKFGARCFGAAVALQYSHTQVERIHMGDLAQLCDFLQAWCLSPLDPTSA